MKRLVLGREGLGLVLGERETVGEQLGPFRTGEKKKKKKKRL